jgi:ABC-type uncharacterized transport system substrate-binding protein
VTGVTFISSDLAAKRLQFLKEAAPTISRVAVLWNPDHIDPESAETTIPIVLVGIGDAVASGVVASLARPGGNITGSTDSVPELMAKLLELLKEIMPRARRVAVLANPTNTQRWTPPTFKAMESTAGALKVELERFEAREPSEFESAFSRIAKSRADAVVVPVHAAPFTVPRIPSSGGSGSERTPEAAVYGPCHVFVSID